MELVPTEEPPQESPGTTPRRRCGSPRTLRGESIRSLRGLLLAASSSSSSLPEHEEKKDNDKSNKDEKQLFPQTEFGGPDEQRADVDTVDDADADADDAGKEKQQQQQQREHADQVRKRLLQNLGIHKQELIVDPPTSANNEPWGASYTLPINDDGGRGSNNAGSTVTTNNNNNNKKDGDGDHNLAIAISEEGNVSNETKPDDDDDGDHDKNKQRRNIHFHPTVEVHPIPSHKVYSNRIRQTIWTGADELAENVARNSLEFSYEDWDASKVVDEDTGLIYLPQQGEWIHPVHCCRFEEEKPPDSTEEELWKQTCERLGIYPAEYYHSLILPPPPAPPTAANR